ncbi:MAG: hypothetical protein N4A72_07085 [Bacteroidales bacterium]|nr:hypothetical protein [Bacteroidales bacterium]
MKNKLLILSSLIFFLLVNTTCFWEGKLGILAMLAFLILVIGYIVLAIGLLRQLILAIRERFTKKYRIFTIVFVLSILIITLLKPYGLVDFDKFSGQDLLIAQREGAANCMTTFKLKENNKFVERSVCFGVSEIDGDFEIINDTIYFSNVNLPRGDTSYYDFALIMPSRFGTVNNKFDLIRYENKNDTIGHELWIIKNEFNETE